MDEVLLRRLVGLVTLVVAAFLLSWLLPRPGLHRLQGEDERVVTMDLTRADSQPQETLLADEAAGVSASEEPTGAQRLVESPASPTSAGMAPVDPRTPPPAPTESARPIWQTHGAPSAAATAAPPQNAEPEAEPEAQPAAPAAALAPAAKPAPVAEPKPEPKPVPKAEARPEAKPAPAPAVAAAIKPPAPKPTAPAPAAAPKPVAKAGGAVTVQAGAFSFLDKAESTRARAQSAGVSCVISPAETAKGTLYRVRCGPFAGKEQASAAVQVLKGKGLAAAIVSGG